MSGVASVGRGTGSSDDTSSSSEKNRQVEGLWEQSKPDLEELFDKLKATNKEVQVSIEEIREPSSQAFLEIQEKCNGYLKTWEVLRSGLASFSSDSRCQEDLKHLHESIRKLSGILDQHKIESHPNQKAVFCPALPVILPIAAIGKRDSVTSEKFGSSGIGSVAAESSTLSSGPPPKESEDSSDDPGESVFSYEASSPETPSTPALQE